MTIAVLPQLAQPPHVLDPQMEQLIISNNSDSNINELEDETEKLWRKNLMVKNYGINMQLISSSLICIIKVKTKVYYKKFLTLLEEISNVSLKR